VTILLPPIALLATVVVTLALQRLRDPRSIAGLFAMLFAIPALMPLLAAELTRGPQGILYGATKLLINVAIVGVVLVLLAQALNVNRFSLHSLYKQGLVRTFLGASRLSLRNPAAAPPGTGAADPQFDVRKPESATDIDEVDNPKLARLDVGGERGMPLLLLNAAVNGRSPLDQVGRSPRQWPFTFGCRFSGSPAAGIGYASTDEFYRDDPGGGLSLGGAMAVSGAAVAPTGGSGTGPVTALLLGLLNARLGMWIGNPTHPPAVRAHTPGLSAFTVLGEMLGLRHLFGRWIHLSDGGHFENLGVYELVRRGCQLIVAIDASCDPGGRFDDLARMIRRVQVDLDVRIYPVGGDHGAPLDARAADEAERPLGVEPWRVFKVDYGDGLPSGRMIYVKPSLTRVQGMRPEFWSYSKLGTGFPHESTLNQFFTERQMEAYRGLGERNAADAVAYATGAGDPLLKSLIRQAIERSLSQRAPAVPPTETSVA
jgi:hypothetical protein